MEKTFKGLSEATPQELGKLQANQSHRQNLMSEEGLQTEFGDKNENDSWGLELRSDTGELMNLLKRIF